MTEILTTHCQRCYKLIKANETKEEQYCDDCQEYLNEKSDLVSKNGEDEQ